MTVVTTPGDLIARLGDPGWAIVDCRFDLADPAWGEREYLRGHIPGAVYASLDRNLSGVKTGQNGRHPLPDPSSLVSTFSAWGIDDGVRVVAYDQGAGMYAARLWWLLRYAGHDAVTVLDGGWNAWCAENGPVARGAETRAAATFVPHFRPDLLATADDVGAASAGGRIRLLDARSPERFRGEGEVLDPVGGHIPGARNAFYQKNLDDRGRWRDGAALRESYEDALGGRSPSETIVYCGSGVSACHDLLALERAGLQGARLYVGSWSEWSSDPARPRATGDES